MLCASSTVRRDFCYLGAVLYLVKSRSLRNYSEDHLNTLVFPSILDVL